MTSGIGQWLAHFSNRIEIADFDDAANTGFGKAFPAFIRLIYDLCQQLEDLKLPGSGIVTYHSERAMFPVMGSLKYEMFPEIKLELFGVGLSGPMGKIARIACQPRYVVAGTVYQFNQEVRSMVTLSKYNRVVERWDLVIWDSDKGEQLRMNSAKEVIKAILKDCHG